MDEDRTESPVVGAFWQFLERFVPLALKVNAWWAVGFVLYILILWGIGPVNRFLAPVIAAVYAPALRVATASANTDLPILAFAGWAILQNTLVLLIVMLVWQLATGIRRRTREGQA